MASESGAAPLVRLAALGACESGISDVVRTPDEFDGFPATLMSLGVPAVLATLWQVEDAASARLVARFFHHWLADWPSRSPACALRLAQMDLMAMPLADFGAGCTVVRDPAPRPRVLLGGRSSSRGARERSTKATGPGSNTGSRSQMKLVGGPTREGTGLTARRGYMDTHLHVAHGIAVAASAHAPIRSRTISTRSSLRSPRIHDITS
ncbi:MAG: CHAT domain-containing protein [Comamonadaceae bacterium]|nr:CHAT domain-containing protein [Comamonadaceae bacterium]